VQYPEQNQAAVVNRQTINARAARPGSVNYIEGAVSIDGRDLNANAVGNAEIAAGQTMTSGNGRAEVLLTPGIFLRLDHDSSVKMVSADLANVEVEIDRGRAMIEATDFRKQNQITVDENGAKVRLLKNGLYDFDFANNQLRVFKGKVQVEDQGKKTDVAEGKQLTLSAGEKLSAKGFDVRKDEDDFYRWSGLRSGYLSEANVDAARIYVNGPGWYGPGWYWDPWYSSYTFLPGAGLLYSPFGWGFYSPFAVWGSPFFYGGGVYHRFGEVHPPYGHGIVPAPAFHGPVGGGFRGAVRGGGGRR
jgi:hypothetical protein